MYNENKQAIETFEAARLELKCRLDRKDWGECSNIHHELEAGALWRKLNETHPRAARALHLADLILWDWTTFSTDKSAAKEHLSRCERDAYTLWQDDYVGQNRCRVAILALKAMASVEIPPIPEPSPEAVERSKRTWAHQLGEPVVLEMTDGQGPPRLQAKDWVKYLGGSEPIPGTVVDLTDGLTRALDAYQAHTARIEADAEKQKG